MVSKMKSINPITFVHCADLHLDSPFEGIHALEPDIASILRDATFKAFDNVVNLAICKKADFLIIAGDVYDGADRSLRAQLRFRDGLRKAIENNIQCFVAHGNHDPLSGWEAGLIMPEGVHRFGGKDAEQFTIRRGSEDLAYIYGISYPVRNVQENLVPRFKPEVSAPFTIGVLHCNVGGDPSHDNYAPCVVDDLVNCRIDYWALGHIHTRKVLSDSAPCIVYPGNTQGRSVRELGARGCYHVRVDETGRVKTEFVATDLIRWSTKKVDITDLDTVDDLLSALYKSREEARSQAEGRAVVLRLRLIGRGDLHSKLKRVEPDRDLAKVLREGESERSDFVWMESIEVATRPPIDITKRRGVEDFVGYFLRAAERLRKQSKAESDILELLKGKPENRVIANQIDHLSDTDLLSILDDAETLGLDQLIGEEE